MCQFARSLIKPQTILIAVPVEVADAANLPARTGMRAQVSATRPFTVQNFPTVRIVSCGIHKQDVGSAVAVEVSIRALHVRTGKTQSS